MVNESACFVPTPGGTAGRGMTSSGDSRDARIARLEKTNVIAGYGVRLGQDVLDASISAYVGIIIAPKYGQDVQKRLGRMPEVQLLCAVSGEFDYVAWLRAGSPDRLNDLLDQIGGLEGVERTTTSIILARKIDRGTEGG